MIILTINHSYSNIAGLDPEQLAFLRKVLSYKIDFMTARFIPNPANHVKYMIDRKGNFPSGLLHRVKGFLATHNLPYNEQNKGILPVHNQPSYPRKDLPVKPYPEQLEAVKVASKYSRGIISAVTGSGKSMIISLLIAELKLKTLVIVPNLTLKHQLLETLNSFFVTMKHITVENIDSPLLTTATDYDCLIIDEAHHVGAKTYHNLNKRAWNKISYRYFFTATPYRNNSEEQLLFEGIAGQKIYELDYKTAVKNKYIVPIEAYYLDVAKSNTDKRVYAGVYADLVVNNEGRNHQIAGLLNNLNEANKFTLCLVKEIAHGEKLSNLTGIPFANGADEESRKYIKLFNSGKLKCLIGTTGLIGEGCDTKPTEYVIIAGLGKAKSSLIQQIGRGIRAYPGKESAKVIIFKDPSHKWTKSHFSEQCKIILDYYGTKVIQL